MISRECISCVFVINVCALEFLKLSHSTFVGHTLGDFSDGTSYSHRVLVIKVM